MLFGKEKQESDVANGKSSSGAAVVAASAESKENRLKQQAMSDRTLHMQELKGRIHRKLVDSLDLTRLESEKGDSIREKVRQVVADLCESENALLNYNDRKRLASEVLDEVFGLGPLEVLLKDPTITDILVNGPTKVYIERGGRVEPTEVRFKDNAHLLHIIDKIVSAVGRRCDEVSPMVDARLPDGSRVNAVIPPLAIDGPAVSIRRFGTNPIRIEDLIEYKSIAPEMVEFLEACVKVKLNIMIVGGTGSGKTTVLNNLSSFIPTTDRIITIEDAAELILQQPHVVRLETRPANIEGKGKVTIRDLLINTLRMRPDRIIVGEVRGAEALDMLQAMNTGHDGSLTTLHSNNPRDAMKRLEGLVLEAVDMPVRAIREQIVTAIDLIVHLTRFADGARKVTHISEVVGMDDDEGSIVIEDIFTSSQVYRDSRKHGELTHTGYVPGFARELMTKGLLSLDAFV